jgi:hypothetical protein
MVGRGDARWVDGQMAGSMLSRRKVRSSLAVRRYEQGRRIGKADPSSSLIFLILRRTFGR